MSLPAFLRRPAVLLILALCALAAVMTALGRLAGGPHREAKSTALSAQPGSQAAPAFSPDGRQLAYSARGLSREEGFHIFVRRLPGGAPRQLTEGKADDIGPAWSPDGASIAFLRVTASGAACMVMPADGGVVGTVAHCAPGAAASPGRPVPALAWTRNGQSLVAVQDTGDGQPALAVVELKGGTVRTLTHPLEGTPGDSMPAVSPDGRTVAFVRATGEGADIWVCGLSGEGLRRVTFDDRPIRGIAWADDGEDLIYASDRGHGWVLARIAVSGGGTPRDLKFGGRQAQFPAVAPLGHRLAYVDAPSVSAIWKTGPAQEPGSASDQPLIRSAGHEFGPAYSPDGTRIADVSDQTGHDEIWVSDRDGGHRVRITDLHGPELWPPRWSPDGRTLLFDAHTDNSTQVYTVPAEAPNGPAAPASVALGSAASWSHDGKSVLFQMRGQIWRANPDGGNPRLVVKDPGSTGPTESEDGEYVYYRKGPGLWRVRAEGGTPERAIEAGRAFPWPGFQPTRGGLYYLGFVPGEDGMSVFRYDSATKRSDLAFHLNNADRHQRAGFSVAPDGKSIIYAREDHADTRLMMVEGFE